MEASMTMIALYYWPSPREPPASRQYITTNFRDLRISLTFAAIGCILRPTNALIWLFLGTKLLLSYPHRVKAISWDVFVTGIFSLAISFAIDVFFYKRWIFIPFEFFKVNVVENISSFYGTHPFHWYFTQAIPLVLFTSLPFCIIGVMNISNSHKRQPFLMCVVVAVTLSFQGHKEFRFLLPLLAPMQLYAGRGLYLLQKADLRSGRNGIRAYFFLSIMFLVLTNMILGLYFSRVHKRGAVNVVHYLRKQAYEGNVTSILFLMPCHSTPFYSHIHLPIPMRYISCEPPLGIPQSERSTYKDETDLLYLYPNEFFATFFPKQIGNKTLLEDKLDDNYFNTIGYTIKNYSWPSHLVWYDNKKLGPFLKPILQGSNYKEVVFYI
jgi:GPI mannosyltransferase 3